MPPREPSRAAPGRAVWHATCENAGVPARKPSKAPSPSAAPDPVTTEPVGAEPAADAAAATGAKRRRRRRAPAAGERRIPTGEPARDRAIDATAPPHAGDLPGELGPPAGESSR